MTDDDLTARLFVRLYTSLLDDEDMLERSYAAIGVYAVTLLLSKHTAADGRVAVKLLRRDAALRPGTTLDDALDELADAGLVTVDDGHVTVRSWGKYNALSADIVARRAARRQAARRANHERWHDGPFEACQRCHNDVSPRQSESDSDRTPPESDPDPQQNPHSHSHSHSDSHSQSSTDGSGPDTPPDGCEPADVDLADRLIETLGYLDQPSTTGERRYTARARRRGWTTQQLEDLAHEVAGRDDLTNPRQFLVACLRHRANTDPDHPPTGDRSPIDLDFTDLTGLPDDPAAEYAARHHQETNP